MCLSSLCEPQSSTCLPKTAMSRERRASCVDHLEREDAAHRCVLCWHVGQGPCALSRCARYAVKFAVDRVWQVQACSDGRSQASDVLRMLQMMATRCRYSDFARHSTFEEVYVPAAANAPTPAKDAAFTPEVCNYKRSACVSKMCLRLVDHHFTGLDNSTMPASMLMHNKGPWPLACLASQDLATGKCELPS